MSYERSRLVDDYDAVPDARRRSWLKRARDFGRSRDGFVEVLPGTSEALAWARYFDGLGWRPVTFPFGLTRKGDVIPSPVGTRSWTAPCRWPAELEAWQG